MKSEGCGFTQTGTGESKGFTLIELLVVVAIIGLLAAVVLASVGGARKKGIDAAVQSSLKSAATQAELYANSNTSHPNTYTGLCTATAAKNGLGGINGPGILNNAADSGGQGGGVNITNGTKGSYNVVTCHALGPAWAVEAPLSSSASGASVMWCVDSTGQSKRETSNIQSNIFVCP